MASLAAPRRHAIEAEGRLSLRVAGGKTLVCLIWWPLPVTDTDYCSRRIPLFVPNCCDPVRVSFGCLEMRLHARGSF